MKQLIHRVFQKKWLCAFLITASSIVFFLLLFVEHYETGDDFWINSIASGFTSDRDYHIVFNNVILGHLLVFLNTVAPQIPWYGLLQYATAFLALSSVVYLLLKNHPPYYILALGLILSFFCYELFIRAEFTKISGVAAASGILLLFSSLDDTASLKKAPLLVSSLLLFLSSLYRFAGFIGALAVWLVYGVVHPINLWKAKQRQVFKRYLIVIPAMLLICLGIWGIDYATYQADEGWKFYKNFLTAEKTLNDFSYPDFSENEDVYQQADINENARHLYSHMDIADPDKYTIPVIETISKAKPEQTISFATFISFLQSSFPIWLHDYPYVYAVLVLFIIALNANRLQLVRTFGLILGTWGFHMLLEYFLYLYGRYSLNRVDMILFYSLGMVAIMLMITAPSDAIPSRHTIIRKEAVTSMVGLICCLIVGGILYHIQPPHTHGIDIEASDSIEKAPQKTFYSLLNEDQENTYFISWAVSDCSISYGPLDPIRYRSATNQIYLGGWLIESPIYHQQLSERGIQNPFQSLVDEPNTFLLQNGVYIENTLSYLNDYYRSDTSNSPYYGVLVKNISGNLVYKITNDELTEKFLSPVLSNLSQIPDGGERLVSYTEIHPTGTSAEVSGSLYMDGENSFFEQLFLVLENKDTGQMTYSYLTQGENPFAGDLFHGQFSAFSGTVHYEGNIHNYHIYLIYKNGDSLYKIKVDEDRIIET